ncbi:MAG TPA: hypothetical protein VHO70_18745, partial [Chitinispirillaceae bacterium]|nr:hypothetical protein [Chitinispirillaceae bacterium]
MEKPIRILMFGNFGDKDTVNEGELISGSRKVYYKQVSSFQNIYKGIQDFKPDLLLAERQTVDEKSAKLLEFTQEIPLTIVNKIPINAAALNELARTMGNLAIPDNEMVILNNTGKIISILATSLINTRSDNSHMRITHSLRLLAHCVDAQKVELYLFEDSQNKKIAEWADLTVQKQLEAGIGVTGSWSWLMSEVKKFKIVILPDVSTLPDIAKEERTCFSRLGIQAIAAVPL